MLPRAPLIVTVLVASSLAFSVAQSQTFTSITTCSVPTPNVYCIWVEPELSPDGLWYAFTDASTWPPVYEWWPGIRVFSLDGSTDFVVGEAAVPNGWHHSPAWSPDGTQLAYVTDGYVGEDAGLWIVNVSDPSDPTNYRQLLRTSVASEPAWSRDGQSIAYVGAVGLWSVDVQGGTVSSLHSAGQSPSWGPEGQIVFVVAGDLWIRETNGTVRRLTNTPWSEYGPAWSPNGTWIAYASNRHGHWDIYLTASTGGTAVRLTSGTGDESNASWSSDGDTIMFHSYFNHDEFWMVTDLPDFTVSVSKRMWGEVKQLYR